MFLYLALEDLCAEIGSQNITFKNTLPYPVELYYMKDGEETYLPRNFEAGANLTVQTDQARKWLFKAKNGGKRLSGCVLGKVTDVFKWSDLAVTCSSDVLVEIFGKESINI